MSWSLSKRTELKSWYRRNWLVILTSSWKYMNTFLKYHSGIYFGLYMNRLDDEFLWFNSNFNSKATSTYLVFSFLLMNVVAAGPLLAESKVVVSALYGYPRSLTTLLANLFWRRCCLRYFLLCCSRLREHLRRGWIPIHISDLIHIEHLRWHMRQGVVSWQEIGSLALHGLREVECLEIWLPRWLLLDGPWGDHQTLVLLRKGLGLHHLILQLVDHPCVLLLHER